MAKASKKVESAGGINLALMASIASGAVTHISQPDGLPLLEHNPQLIDVNTNDIVNGNAAVKLTDAGAAYVAANYQAPAPASDGAVKYAVITNAVLPPSKRGGGGRSGAPVQYPFDSLEVGHSFFVPVSTKHPDPVKTLGSTVSSANMRFSEPTGEMKTVERTKRGEKNKAVLDAAGNKIKETVTVAVRKPLRKFTIRPVEAGKTYGSWVADQDGALIQRTM